MNSGYCSCPRGAVCAPCRHKSSVSKLFKRAEFSVVPCDDPYMCAMYHYIATGTTLEAHMYRKRGDVQSVPDIQKFIDEKLNRIANDIPNQSLMLDDSAVLLITQDEAEEMEIDNYVDIEEDNEEEMVIANTIKEQYLKAMNDYALKVVSLHEDDPKDPAMLKAMRAMTKTLKKSLKCNKPTFQKQMHLFGKGTAAARITKSGRVIYPNTPAISARKAPGRGPAPLGRPPLPKNGLTIVGPSTSGMQPPIIAMSDNPPRISLHRPHNFTHNVDNNLPGAR